MTSLIDVIFLLLLFFMLTSNFSRFGELELVSQRAGEGVSASSIAPMFFLQVSNDKLVLNGEPIDLIAFQSVLTNNQEVNGVPISNAGGTARSPIVVSVAQDVAAQRLVDVLHIIEISGAFDVRIIH
ncbi:MAG: biopolymer transporter ExbD [Sphingopyxis sp.]|nr:biopolymer transporter ExbD [Sphingopyxis sp.]